MSSSVSSSGQAFRGGICCATPQGAGYSPLLTAELPPTEDRDLSRNTKFRKQTAGFSLLFLTEKSEAQNFGREFVFSADLWYNGANEKPLPLGEVAAKPTERVRLWNETPSHPLSRELSQRESLKTRATLGVWAMPEASVASNAGIGQSPYPQVARVLRLSLWESSRDSG